MGVVFAFFETTERNGFRAGQQLYIAAVCCRTRYDNSMYLVHRLLNTWVYMRMDAYEHVPGLFSTWYNVL